MTTATQTIQKGYKQTDVGVIPADWDVKRLGDIVQFNNGKAHEQFINDKGNYVVVNSKFISTEGEVFKTSDKNLSPLFEGEVVMVMSDIPHGRALAKCFFIRENGKYTLNQRICSFKSINSDSLYLFYKLNRNKYFLDFDSGVGQTNLKKSEVLDCPISLPSNKDEQYAIATTLSDTDTLITKLEALIEKKKNIKQGAMQELLTGKRRLPGFSGEWENKSIEELEKTGDIKLSRGKVISKRDIDNFSGNYPIYSSSIHNNGEFGRYGLYMFEEELITWSVDGGGNFFYRPKHKFSVTNVCGFMRVNTKRFSYQFLATQLQFLHSKLFFDYTMKAHPSVIRKAYSVDIPNLAEQTAIAKVFFDMDTEIEKLESELMKYKDIKQGMKQVLLTGKIRLLSK